MPTLMLLSGWMDFLNSLLWPIESVLSFVLGYAYRGWSLLTGGGTGLTWVLTIMTLTVIVRTLMIPLFVKQINSSRDMQLIQPKLKELQDKYGADRNQLGIETQKMMKEAGVNPLASCFPMLIQMPVFMSLYYVLYGASADPPVARGWFLEHNLDVVKSLNAARLFGAKLAGHFWLTDWSLFGPTQIMAIILVILMAGSMFYLQKQITSKNMSPEAMTGQFAQTQKMMIYMMPLMYVFMGAFFPVGVMVYWVTSNFWTLIQQWLLIRNNPTPGTPAYVDWEERMIRQGKDPVQLAADRLAKRRGTADTATGSRTVGPARQSPSGNKDGLRNAYGNKDRTDDDNDGDGEDNDGDSTGGIGAKGPGGSGGKGGGRSAEAGDHGEGLPRAQHVQRQQIQRQQPKTQSRATRTTKKKK